MIAGLKPYLSYRAAEGGWFGAIPSHWRVSRMKYVVHEVDSRSITGTEQLLRVSQYTGVTERRLATELDGADTRADSLIGYKRVEPNDLVINIMLAWNGSIGVSAYDGIASPAYCVYRFRDQLQPWYFHNLLRSPAYKARIKASSTGVVESRLRLYSEDLGRVEALIPPPDEQAAIVRFLDWANGRLERAIRAKRKVIALLNEQKQAVIHRAVTRGVDPSVPLKPSGVPWLGDIPEHWEVRKLGMLFRVQGSGTTPSGESFYSGPTNWVMSGDLNDSVICHTKRTVNDEALKTYTTLKVYPSGSLVVAMYGATIGKTGILGEPACTNQACCVFAQPVGGVQVKMMQLIVQTAKSHLMREAYGGGQPNINAEVIRSLRIGLAPAEEQQRIVRSLDALTRPLATAMSGVEREINLLREYRTRLVADVVTGKLDVREAAAHLPNEAGPVAEDDHRADLESQVAEDEAVA